MATIFDLTLSDAQKRIFDASNQELSSTDFESKLFNRSSIESPRLDKGKTTTQVGSEIVSFLNAPENITFVPGEPMEFALISVPIIGDLELFVSIAGYLFDKRTKYMYSNTACYKEYGRHPITGNDALANEIMNRAKIFFESIDKQLDDFKQKADKFNEEVLKPEIAKFIEKERQRRDVRKNSEQKLNPFL